IHEGKLAGAVVPAESLKAMQEFFIKTQDRAGGWGYRGGGASMTMSTAGLCNLIITGLDLGAAQQKLRPNCVADKCGAYADVKPSENALKWIGERFPPALTSDTVAPWGSPFYCMYGIERAGRLTGQRFFGGHDWSRLGCQHLVEIQRRDGSWIGA